MFLGWQSFNTLPITRFPTIDVPLVAVTVNQSGAAPAELEAQVTKEIEDAVAGITGVKNIISTVTDGVSTTAVEFRMEVPTDKAVQDVKDAIDQIVGDLPGGIEAPIVTRIDVEGQAIMTFAVAAPDMSIEELSWFVDDVITRALQGKRGVGRVTRFGGADREIRIVLDPLRLDSFGITARRSASRSRATPTPTSGRAGEIGAGEQAIRVLGDAAAAEELAATTIALPSGRFVRLGDLGRVIDTYEELRSLLALQRRPGRHLLGLPRQGRLGGQRGGTRQRRARRDPRGASGRAISLVDDTVFYTYGNYKAALHTLIEGALLAVLVVLLFLRNWRATLIAAVALPLSAVPTFWVMDLLGFSLNLVSFLAITLATGILVDDAIVEVENIARHMRMGKSPYRAAMDAADEIGLAVIATSATIIAVFVPVSASCPASRGQYFSQFGLTVAIAVFFSLLVARLITPLMAAYLMRSKDALADHDHADGPVMRGYLWLVRRTTSGRFLFIPARYLTLLSAIGALDRVALVHGADPGQLHPARGREPHLALDRTAAGLAARGYRRRRSGRGRGSSRDRGRGQRLRPRRLLAHGRPRRAARLRHRDARQARPFASAQALPDRGAIPVVGPLLPQVENTGREPPAERHRGRDLRARAGPARHAGDQAQRPGRAGHHLLDPVHNEADLNLAAARLESALRGDPLLANVATEGALPRPEVQIVPRQAEAARLGVTTAAIAETVRVASIGDFDAALAKVSIDNRQIPVRVELDAAVKEDLARIKALRVPTATGATVPLASVADVVLSEGPASIDRLNRERRVTIGANLPVGVALGTATARFKEIVATVELPPSVRVAESGDAEIQAELTQSFGNAMIMGLMLVLTVLILLFKSVIQPFTILFSLPLAIGGVAAALILTNSAVSMPVLIGILMLMGIVTKNAILLVDFAIEMRAQGMDRVTAMIEAGHKRARPIVMTSIAMSAGMLPSALGVGEGGSFRAPMATAVIGGIVVSTC
jgi:multidrug efflux pump subunit AcrB